MKTLNNGPFDPLKLRIGYLTDSSLKLFDKLPQISHHLMRCAIGFSSMTNKGVTNDCNVCKGCGIILVPCVNLEVRCRKSTKRNRKTFKKYIKKKFHKVYYKNKMVYKCKTCGEIVNIPSICKHNKVK